VRLAEEERSVARGRRKPAEDSVVGGGGKAKVRARPASDRVFTKGRAKTSAPREICRRSWCGVWGLERTRRGRGPRVGWKERRSGRTSISYKAKPESWPVGR